LSLDSEKIQKLSLDTPDPVTGFQALVLENSDSPQASMPAPKVMADSTVVAGGSFGLPGDFWKWIAADIGLKREFDKMIDARVAERVVERFETFKAEVAKEAEAVGFKKGLEQSGVRIGEATSKLEQICAEVVLAKTSLLNEHEGQWMRAFSHMLRRFLVHRSSLASEEIERWLQDSIAAFETKGAVKIFLSTRDYRHLAKVIETLQGSRWKIEEDKTLQDGELHCACEDGGVLFSSEEEMKKLEVWIERFSAGGESH